MRCASVIGLDGSDDERDCLRPPPSTRRKRKLVWAVLAALLIRLAAPPLAYALPRAVK